ncbi:ATP-grasp domain-containing protein [Ligilactobacillus ceti]|uniref:Phosphoribosylaminoimidazole carboxylase ncair mutase subunit n=1 Tax=Ligilactobacillus ceti DSM 22408 TaxID=1122146 RepID=A0A0R2KM37_9LACO|nr:ATP-grasp domain-containing protein [Ligilactobacillus ceti]KRN90559.1 phosphoribosylaminoimidazole carboxylase ncair mutase subunit [Ligilactobacillus ceti DSM 22408]
MDKKIIFPGDTLGVIGDSPNGIMLVEAAKKLGLTVIAYSNQEASPTLKASDVKIVGELFDLGKLRDFGERCDVVVYESVQVAADIIEYLSQYTYIPQNKEALVIAQDRLLERTFLEQLNINIAPYATIVSLDDIYQTIGSIGYPCILKPIQKGFFKNRQRIIRKQTDIAKCSDIIEQGTYVLESLIPYSQELSIILSRDCLGNLKFFPIAQDVYREYHLHQVLVPSQISDPVETEIKRIASQIATALEYVGVMQVSFYMTEQGNLYVKKFVPTLSQTGFVFDKATNISMFEQHLRTICNLPMATPKLLAATAVVMLEKDKMEDIRTQWILKDNWFYNFYRYPKSLQGRNMGYLLVTAPTIHAAKDQIESTGIWE